MFVHWPDYGINPGMTAEVAKRRAAELLEAMGKDERHLKWFIENCAEGLATQIKRCEDDYVRCHFFPPVPDMPLATSTFLERQKEHLQKIVERRLRLLRGMQLLGCLHAIAGEQLSKSFAAGLGDYFKTRRAEPGTPATKEGGRG